MSMDRADREYLAAGFALGGLSDDDLAAAQHLLESDPSFRREVAEYEDSFAGLAETDAPLTVSKDAEAAILAIPRTEGGQSASGGPPSAERSSAGPPTTEASAVAKDSETAGDSEAARHSETARDSDTVGDQPVSLDALRASRRTWRVVAGVAAAAAVVAIAGLGGALLHVAGEQRDLDESLAQSQEELDRTERLLSASDVRTDTVDLGDDGRMTVAWSVSEQVFQVRPHGAPTVSEDRVMQLWLIDDSGAHSVGFLAEEAVYVDGSEFTDGALVGVTEEPVGGSPQPTSDPLAVVEL
ncbi:anti-sigma factor domain-containing protein [Brevibacterium yomogidense]|uniref:anti-sigma factor domain-containing protein n=1 Tax=Brevibacterium yomogidense TaxID=946573 RepID=UPI0018E04ADD|nr:anti-sigma factor [Brevibacterium yomogidense]